MCAEKFFPRLAFGQTLDLSRRPYVYSDSVELVRMYTRCPHCHTYFKISADQLKKAGGKVRCGQCTKVFNSLGNLLEQLPIALSDRNKAAAQRPMAPPTVRAPAPIPPPPAARITAAATPKPAAAPRPPLPKPAAPLIPPRPAPKPIPAPTPKPAPAAPKIMARQSVEGGAPPVVDETKTPAAKNDDQETLRLTDEDKIEDVPGGSFSAVRDLVLYPGPRVEAPPELFGNAFWGTGVAILLTIFILQYTYSMRDDLARYPELRPWVQKMCEIAQCDMPMQQNVDLIKLTHRDITIHPRVKGALLINAVFVNNASFTQPFPLMQITLSDMNGRIIAKRRFQPTEYLDADVNLRRGMMPNNPVQIVLEIADPGKDAVNFEFNFFYQTSS